MQTTSHSGLVYRLGLLKFFDFPLFSVIPRTLQKIKEDKSTGICVLSDWPTRAWYPQAARRSPPNEQELTSHSLSLVRKTLINTNNKLSDASQDIILTSWRDGTAKQYKTYLVRWEAYCNSNKLDMINPGIENAIEFLTDILKSGSGYSTITLLDWPCLP